jgi:hypothetical protein
MGAPVQSGHLPDQAPVNFLGLLGLHDVEEVEQAGDFEGEAT